MLNTAQRKRTYLFYGFLSQEALLSPAKPLEPALAPLGPRPTPSGVDFRSFFLPFTAGPGAASPGTSSCCTRCPGHPRIPASIRKEPHEARSLLKCALRSPSQRVFSQVPDLIPLGQGETRSAKRGFAPRGFAPRGFRSTGFPLNGISRQRRCNNTQARPAPLRNGVS